MKFLSKLIFYFRKPKIIMVTGEGRANTAKAIYQVLRQFLLVRKISDFNFFPKSDEILIFETEPKRARAFSFFAKNSKLPILVVTHFGEIPQDNISFAGEKGEVEEVLNLVKVLPPFAQLILNFDDETVREIRNLTNLKTLTFGFQEGADFLASDIKLNTGINFKLNYQGNVVPIWLDSPFDKNQLYAALAAISVGTIFNLNLVEISQALKNYKGFSEIDKI